VCTRGLLRTRKLEREGVRARVDHMEKAMTRVYYMYSNVVLCL
jgi:hypothetical protein